MRLATFTYDARMEAGLVVDDVIFPITKVGSFPATLDGIIGAGPDVWEQLRGLSRNLDSLSAAGLPLSEVRLRGPIAHPPRNVICLGRNYAAHARESAETRGEAVRLPAAPVVFTKSFTSLIGPYDDIALAPGLAGQLDWEVELAVIIGTYGKNIAPEDALDHVFGYTIMNDVTARELQSRHQQFFLGKSVDAVSPIGPWIVTDDEIPNPQNLQLRCSVNGILKQAGSTSDQIFSIATIIAIISRTLALMPGDIIATGTPEGVGFARRPPEFLAPGDVLVSEIDGIGMMRNVVREARDA